MEVLWTGTRRFGGIATDLALEQFLNKRSKSNSGTTGITLNDKTCNKWFLTSHNHAQMLESLKEMAGMECKPSDAGYIHYEYTSQWTQKEEDDVQGVIALLDRYECNLCKENQGLVNIATRLSPPQDKADDIISPHHWPGKGDWFHFEASQWLQQTVPCIYLQGKVTILWCYSGPTSQVLQANSSQSKSVFCLPHDHQSGEEYWYP